MTLLCRTRFKEAQRLSRSFRRRESLYHAGRPGTSRKERPQTIKCMRENDVVRVGIIGAGAAARHHANAIVRREDAQLVAVAASALQSAQALTSELGGTAVTVPALLARRDVDLVVICSPHDLHCEHMTEAADAGKHILVEKPIGLRWKDAETAVLHCRAKGVLVGVVHPRRFDDTWASIFDLTRSGVLGRLLWVDASVMFHRPPQYYESSWRGRSGREGGPHLTQGFHHLDIVRWLMDAAEPPAMQIASAASQSAALFHSTETADSLAAQFRTRRGAFGTIRISTGLSGLNTTRVDLSFEAGFIGIVDDVVVVRRPAADEDLFAGLRSGTYGWGSDAMSRVLADMCDAIRHSGEPRVDGLDAVQTLRFCEVLFDEMHQDSALESTTA